MGIHLWKFTYLGFADRGSTTDWTPRARPSPSDLADRADRADWGDYTIRSLRGAMIPSAASA
jgi:hypothetical protein